MFRLIRVDGDSMSPALENGDYILIKKARSQVKLRPGLIYVVNHDRLGRIIKRLKSVDQDGLWFSGDNPASTSTQSLGPARPSDLNGRAFLRIFPQGIRLI